MIKYQDNLAARINGNALQPLSGAEVRITSKDTGIAAVVYADDGLTVLVQPLITDDNGHFEFRALNGEYTLTISSPRFVTFTREIELLDVDDVHEALTALSNVQETTTEALELVQAKLAETVSVKDFGAKLDGTSDDAVAIQLANDLCETVGAVLAFPSGTALIKSPIRISAPWRGVPGKTKIRVSSDFAYSGTGGEGLAAILNKNFSLAYNAATADLIDIRGIDFVVEQATGLSKSLLVFANVKGGIIDGVNATTNTSAMTGSLLDLYACTKNLTVRRSTFTNLTQAAAGGAVWVRNITADGSNTANTTENILFDQCGISTTTVDEAIAVYGVRGKTRNVTVRRTSVASAPSPVKHGTLASAFPLNDGSLIGGVNYAAVEGILWDDCDFNSDNFNDHVLRFGNTADASQQCENIKVRNSRFRVKQSAVRTSYAVRIIKNVGDGLTVEGCHIDATGSGQVITYGISGADRASGNSTLGNLTYAADSCKLVDGNPSLSAASGTFNCRDVRNNRIFATSIGCVFNSTDTFNTSNNRIELTASGTAGIFYNTLGNSTAPAGDAIGNTIVMANAAGFAVQVSGSAPGKIRAINNKITGTGKTITGKFTQISGNDWYGKLDSMRAAAYLDYDHNYATPIGTFAAMDAPVMGTSRLQTGWVKTANAGSGADWKAVYMETVAN